MANFIDDYLGSLRDPNKGLTGVYRARVENNKDPMMIGRIQIRVPMLHGFPRSGIPKNSLPWAYPVTASAGFGYGTFIVPEVGEYVFVMFEDCDRTKPIYIGSSFGSGASAPKRYGNRDGLGVWYSKANVNEIPEPAKRKEPTRKIIYKSPKGSSVEVDEKNKDEKIAVTDALGQMLKFEPHLKYGAKHKRVDGDMDTLGDVMKYSYGARVVLKGAGKQNIEMITTEDGTAILNIVSDILNISSPSMGMNGQDAFMSGEDSVTITCGEFKIKIENKNDDTKAYLIHDSGSMVEVEKDKVTTKGISEVDVKAPIINLCGNVNIMPYSG